MMASVAARYKGSGTIEGKATKKLKIDVEIRRQKGIRWKHFWHEVFVNCCWAWLHNKDIKVSVGDLYDLHYL